LRLVECGVAVSAIVMAGVHAGAEDRLTDDVIRSRHAVSAVAVSGPGLAGELLV